ncbi:GNAT family N-acetyltransferase [Actinomycetospora lutea]|uniref:GNAT family N-acetyltransferase n=1 Tax=Actinomycetospora lutea TaxID=663604 RepID=UPI002365B36E|nr:GNAT family N-acetyltransferase [Actinomycetospora lutea]MDD7941369.1 GNAT family N-acetyltransferase [Actinomycetospora lutea]
MDDTDDVAVREDPERGAFVLAVDGVEAGHVDVRRRRSPSAIVLIHTEVEPAYGGRGLGGRLVRGVFDAARAEGIALVPLCEYAQRWVGLHPEYLADVPPHDRQRLGLPEPQMAGEDQ